MIPMLSMLVGEIIYEIVVFIIMCGLITLAVIIGKNLRKRSDAKKAAKEDTFEQIDATSNNQ